MTAILGISAYYHDSAAALVVDGEIVAAAQEERFTRKKHDHGFPSQAIEFCLQHAGLTHGSIDYVGFYDKPLRKFERLLETYVSYAPLGFMSFTRAMPLWIKQKLHLPREIRTGLRGAFRKRVVFCEHHESHAASAFFPSPFDDAAILTIDGVGEWATASIGVGRGNHIELLKELHFPHSLGLLYSAMTFFCGFKVSSGEYKLMGLAPFGTPAYKDLMLRELIDLKDDGSFRLNMRYFTYCHTLRMTGRGFERLFGGAARRPETPITQRECDLAASVQAVTEEVMLRISRHAHDVTQCDRLCLAGGVALNCVGNGRVLRDGPFESVWVQPAAGDAGGALGVALLIWHQLLDKERATSHGRDRQRGSLLGPAFGDGEITTMLDAQGATYDRVDNEEELCRRVSEALADEKVVGWFQGRMEFGPRALGARSILGDARSPRMQSVMNLKTKFRESFRPFAPVVLAEQAGEYFHGMGPRATRSEGHESPYMLLVTHVNDARLTGHAGSPSDDVLTRVNEVRSQIPAVTHVDNSARVQTVDAGRNPRLHRLLTSFHARTGCPVLINTSFNVRGEPIVCTPLDAYRCFMATNMDVLVLGDFVLEKSQQTNAAVIDVDEHLAKFELD